MTTTEAALRDALECKKRVPLSVYDEGFNAGLDAAIAALSPLSGEHASVEDGASVSSGRKPIPLLNALNSEVRSEDGLRESMINGLRAQGWSRIEAEQEADNRLTPPMEENDEAK